MSNPSADDQAPLDPAAARIVARVRWMMMLSGAATLLGIAVVIGVIGYRVFKTEGSAATSADVTMALPKGARMISTVVADGRIAVTIQVSGRTEIRLYDLRTLQPAGRLTLDAAP